jgi:hypothetical protein
MNWLETIVSQHRELESPASFWYWSGICSISAVVKDNIWLDRQIYSLYPNIYVMFHADSGLKKGPPVAMARRLVSIVNNTKIIGGRSSIQGILKDMGTGQGYTQPGGKIVKQEKSVAFICSSELSSSIVEDKVATKILTDLYDRQYNLGEWRSLLKMETFTLKDPTVTMLTATNEAMTEDFFTRSAIQGGYFARTFIVYEKESENINSLSVPLDNPPNDKDSSEYLKALGNLRGAFQPLGSISKSEIHQHELRNPKTGRQEFFSDAGLVYEEWYREFKNDLKINKIKDETGTLNRFGDSVLKVAMLLALARSSDLIISKDSMEEAIMQCEKLIGNIRQTTLGTKGLSPTKSFKTAVLRELFEREDHKISRTMLMQKMWMNYGESSEFDEMMQSLEQAGLINFTPMGNQIIIGMPDEQVKEFSRFFAGKKMRKI